MTAPFEIEEPEPVPFSGLLRTRCRVCRTSEALAAPDQVGNAMCGPCRQQEASAAATIQRLPAETPSGVEWEPSQRILAENGAEGFEVTFPVCPPDCVHAVPSPVTDLLLAGLAAGWQTVQQHSRGKPAGARTVSEIWSVRFRRPGWAGYAVRVGAAWKSVAVSGETLPPLAGALGVTELREWLEQPERDASWYAKIKKRRAEQELAGKQRACPGPGKCSVMLVGDLMSVLVIDPLAVYWPTPEHTHRANGEIKIKNSRAEAKVGL